MAEQLTLSSPVVVPTRSTTTYSLIFFWMDLELQHIVIRVRSNLGERLEFTYDGAIAVQLMSALNTANMATKSLQRRVLERLNQDGRLVGAVSGTPD